ncbi:unnamed protein product [Candidula unifasciata]|uniref:E3 ubiquitin-protein ligase CHFR n=1 Tax=Candidula unifasciata TaxID=100452 RepID=A0A8S4A2T9_9EUPU|nr:unnamed protein product [Candidula unifasciata]
MAEVIPCLLRVGDSVKKYKIFKLDREKVTIGRSPEVTYAISSNMISRCHAVIKRQMDNTWTIADNKSLNGTFINGQQIEPSTTRTLQEGDLVQFGVPVSPDAAAEFVYKFYSSLKVRMEKAGGKKLKLESNIGVNKETLGASESFEMDDCEMKRKKACIQASANSRLSDSREVDSSNNSVRQLMEESHKRQVEKEAEYLARLAEMERLLKEKEEHERQEELEQERKEKEHQAKEVEELKLMEQVFLQEMRDKQEELEREKEELKMKMQAELEASVKERETTLMAQLVGQRELLLSEKKQVEESLQKEMEKALEEKNKELEQQLLNQKQKLEKVLEMKDMEQKLLENQLNETKQENVTAKLQVLKAREDILSNFVELMEMELQCAICNELFIKATSLNCAHVFCKLCIGQWMKVKKECPNCRCPVTSQLQAIALDSYIDKMVEQLNDEMKQRRASFVEQRKAEQDKFDAAEAGPSSTVAAAATTTNTGGAGAARGTGNRRARGRPRGRGRGRNRGRGAAAFPQQAAPTPLIEISDEGSSSLSDASADYDLDDVDREPYYGGYGNCYICGLRGHWASGCPDRR